MTLSVVFDINHFFHTEYSVYSYRSNGKIRDEKDEKVFMAGVVARFAATVGKLPAHSVVVCADSRSWRKAVEIPASPENPEGLGYKSSRQEAKDKTMDEDTQKRFYSLIEEFGRMVEARGMVYSVLDGFEGDDLVAAWAKRLNDKGHCVVAITGDGDLSQVVTADWTAGTWTVVWSINSNSNKMFVPAGWQDQVLVAREQTIFDMGVGVEEQIKAIVRDQQVNVVKTDPKIVSFNKVMLGDSGDDVPSVWSVSAKTKKGEDKVVRVTPKVLTQAIEWMRSSGSMPATAEIPDVADEAQMVAFAGVVLRTIGATDGDAEREAFLARVKLNLNLVSLVGDYLPADSLKESVSDHLSNREVSDPERSGWTKDGLVAGTRFEGGAVEKRFDPFAFTNEAGMI